MYQSHYQNGAGQSSSGMKDNFRGGRDAYQKDMYDMMPEFSAVSVGVEPNGGIQGNNTANGTGNKDQSMSPSSNDGSKDYGRGNPFKKTKKKLPTSIADLRKMAKRKGAY